MIKEGDKLPAGTIWELPVEWTVGCPTGPDAVSVQDATKAKTIAIFGLPGASTRTRSAKHLTGFVEHAEALREKGVDEIWCFSVNDAMVMAAWGKDNEARGKARMMGDGSALYTQALGLDTDLTARGMDVRCQRFAMLVDDGVVKKLNVEPAGQCGASGAETMLQQPG